MKTLTLKNLPLAQKRGAVIGQKVSETKEHFRFLTDRIAYLQNCAGPAVTEQTLQRDENTEIKNALKYWSEVDKRIVEIQFNLYFGDK